MDSQWTVLHDQERLGVLRDLALIDSPQELFYDRITKLAKDAISADVALVSMVADHYQFFKSCIGLPNIDDRDRSTPVEGSFCRHVVATNEPLIVHDAPNDPRVMDHSAIESLGMISYLGMPLTLSDGKRLGSFCVYNKTPHEWTETEVSIVKELSEIVIREIDLKAQVRVDPSYQPKLERAHQAINALIESLNTDTDQETFLTKLRQARSNYDV